MHPDQRQLASLLVGTLDQTEAETLLSHVAHCPQCERTLASLESQTDELVSALRQPSAEPAFVQEPECQSLVASISQLAAPPHEGATAPYVHVPDYIREYELVELLGRGGMGAVYLARHTHLDRLVAIKLLSPERCRDPLAVARFERELRAVGKLDHPHIVKAYDAGNWSGQPYLVMELVDGINLSRLLQRRSRLRVPDACELIRQAALGLAHAHQRNLVHRDVKLSNLMLCRTGDGSVCVKVLDLGLASIADAPRGGAEELTRDCHTLGTPEYMAPEQATAARDVDARADVYALGVSLFKLLADEVPISTSKYPTAYLLIAAKSTEPVPDILQWRSDVGTELAAVVQRMLQPSPAERFASCEEVAAALAPLAQGADLRALLEDRPHPTLTAETFDQPTQPASATPGGGAAPQTRTAAEPVRRPARRRWTAVGLAASIAAVLLGVLVFKFATRDGTILVQLRNVNAAEMYVDNEKVELEPAGGPNTFRVAVHPGQRTITVKTPDGVELSTNLAHGPLRVRAGQTIQIEAWFEPAAVPPQPTPPQPTPSVAAATGTSPQQLLDEDQHNREVARWVFSLGGSLLAVDSNSQSLRISDAESAAQQAFRITSVSLNVDPLGSADELRRLQGLSRLVSVSLSGRVTDAHLAAVATLAPVRDVFVGLGRELTDASLTHLAALPRLESITIAAGGFTDNGLQALQRMPALQRLALPNTPELTDACLAHLGSCSQLTMLDLSGVRGITGAGLRHLDGLPQLETLFLSGTRLDDNTAVLLGPLVTLRELRLQSTQVTDAALEHIGLLVRLRMLEIGRNRIRGPGLKHLTALQELDSLI